MNFSSWHVWELHDIGRCVIHPRLSVLQTCRAGWLHWFRGRSKYHWFGLRHLDTLWLFNNVIRCIITKSWSLLQCVYGLGGLPRFGFHNSSLIQLQIGFQYVSLFNALDNPLNELVTNGLIAFKKLKLSVDQIHAAGHSRFVDCFTK